MNPVAAIDAAAAAAGPHPVLQAWAAEAAAAAEGPTSEAPTSEAPATALAEALAPSGPGLLSRLALPAHRLAETTHRAAIDPALPAAPAPDPPAVPVLLATLHALPGRPAPAEGRRRQQRDETDNDDPSSEEAESTPATPSPAKAAPAPADAVRRWLAARGPAAAAAELAAGRCLLLVMPAAEAGRGDARAWLLSATSERVFHATWTSGTRTQPTGSWWPWRVFRDGEQLRGRGNGGVPCRVHLGSMLDPAPDGATVRLDIADRLRFLQRLGDQWSLLLLVAPPGEAP